MQLYKVYFISNLLYMFRAVSPPIIRNTNNFIYSIWYYKLLLLPVGIAKGSNNS